MDNQLKTIAESYDKAIKFGKKGIDLYSDLPEYITNNPSFQKWKEENADGDSACKEIKEYLSPNKDMKFIDLGCCLNLMFYGYDKWPSTYYGMDISNETIKLLNKFVNDNNLSIGSLICGSIDKAPFEDNYFDIGACIGVLEYFKKDYVEKAIIEMHRIIKPDGKIVIDIPNIENSTCKLMMSIEEYLGRPDKFNMLLQEFECMLQTYFVIEKTNGEAMIKYYLKRKNGIAGKKVM